MVKWDPKRLADVYEWAKAGATNKEIAAALGIDDGTFYRWKAGKKDFCDALTRGRLAMIPELKAAVFREAVGYDYREQTVITDTAPDGNKTIRSVTEVTRHARGDMKAALAMLRCYAEDWRDTDAFAQEMRRREVELRERRQDDATPDTSWREKESARSPCGYRPGRR